MVGSRNATAQGASNAEQFARSFSAAGLTIVSGLAQGIDAAAHRGGLAGEGSTIAVLGNRRRHPLPAGKRGACRRRSPQRGLLVSEFALGTKALAHNFPRRNRLISGLAQGCLVIEAALASGSLITARAAAEQGREVFAVPGSIHSPLSKGCHSLIKSGAKLVESAEDVLSELAAFRRTGFASHAFAAPTPSAASGRRRGAAARLAWDSIRWTWIRCARAPGCRPSGCRPNCCGWNLPAASPLCPAGSTSG